VSAKDHWERIYATSASERRSWYQRVPTMSLEMIARTGVSADAAILDVGGGDSTLVDHLLGAGYTNVAVLDISRAGLDRAQHRLGSGAARVRWIRSDVLRIEQVAPSSISVWHDRAVFHFLTAARDRAVYLEQLRVVLRPAGHVIIATFADDGPSRCSGLPVARYSSQALHAELGTDFQLADARRDAHVTPSGAEQPFTYARFVRR
jgi:ubiquinone/menaquinone biosynthesis C-methylase UbiE